MRGPRSKRLVRRLNLPTLAMLGGTGFRDVGGAQHASTGEAARHTATHDDPPAPSSAELVLALIRAGARVVARQEHGVMLEVRRRLVFLRRTAIVDAASIADAMRAAGIDRPRLDELLRQPGAKRT